MGTTNKGISEVDKFDSNSQYLTHWERTGEGKGELSLTTGVAVDTIGNVYVVIGFYI
jgi:hypothetical protein